MLLGGLFTLRVPWAFMKKYPVYAHGLMSHSHIAVIVPSQPLGDLTPWVPRSRVNPVSHLRLVDVFTTIAPASKLILVPADGTEQLEDGDGQITTTELSSLLHALSTPIHDIDNIIAQADANEDGALDLGEFLLLMSEKLNSGQKTDTELRQVFDRDQLTDQELAMIMREVDADGDGRVSFEDDAWAALALLLQASGIMTYGTDGNLSVGIGLEGLGPFYPPQQGGGLNPGLAGSGEAAAFHATGPQIPNEEVLSTLDKPLSPEELKKREEELNK
ncbi:calmodulin-like protein [Rhizoctonia solani]|uniref:Calmodulin-like protein n=1 Tax=Rhizoctonia solani TaxID=456999 RepID=A0A8H7LWQ2_9AGAM|nr:calmodulin-like protein [Rhizoctonia solani]